MIVFPVLYYQICFLNVSEYSHHETKITKKNRPKPRVKHIHPKKPHIPEKSLWIDSPTNRRNGGTESHELMIEEASDNMSTDDTLSPRLEALVG